MVEVSRDGKRVYFTNSLYGAWDDQFYPDGVGVVDGEARRRRRRRDRLRREVLHFRLPRSAVPPGTPSGWGRLVRFLLLLLDASGS